MTDKLTGSFSGLWSCEICGETGTGCTCEHFARNSTRGRDKTLSDAELAAEYYRGQIIKYRVGIVRDSLVWASIVDGTDYREAE